MRDFDLTPMAGTAWRMVESQHRVSTLKLVDTLEEQALLEELLEDTKPPIPPDCAHLHYLLFTPFRYDRDQDSRFARAGTLDRAFYAAKEVTTAVAEIVFHRLLFFKASPDTPMPANPIAFSAFQVAYETAKGVDLTGNNYCSPNDYAPCLEAADHIRGQGGEVILSKSVRDPNHGMNITLLTCAAFAHPAPLKSDLWHLRLTPSHVLATGPEPKDRLEFRPVDFAQDSRFP